MVISPELAEVLATIISRVRDENGAVPFVVAYDYHERLWNPPMPLLFQRHFAGENRPITGPAIRELITTALAGTGLTDASGQPLRFVPHDFRHFLITDSIMHGMPPHIAQLVAGHSATQQRRAGGSVRPSPTRFSDQTTQTSPRASVP